MNSLKKLVQSRRLSTIIVGLLSAAKLISDMLGWKVITSQQINDIANGAAAVLTVITVVMSHMKSGSSAPPAASPSPAPDVGSSDSGGGQGQSDGSTTPAAPSSDETPPDTPLNVHTTDPSAASDGYARPPQ